MYILIASVVGFAADQIFADPEKLPHPVVLIGKMITAYERRAFARTDDDEKKLLSYGRRMSFLIPFVTLLLSGAVLFCCYKIHPLLFLALECFWCFQCLALCGLKRAAKKVYAELRSGNVEAARNALSMIVGRDTGSLSKEGIIRGAVETVAENASDGVIAPLLFMMIGGAPLALCYKAVNTLDSMVGYKNEKYLAFGRASALWDDKWNYLPARISALLLIVSCRFCGFDAANAVRIWKRDRRAHASPNSAQTESCVAGALHIRLAGPAYYFGQYFEKSYIGDDDRPVEEADILKTNRMVTAASVTALIIFVCIRFLVILLIGNLI